MPANARGGEGHCQIGIGGQLGQGGDWQAANRENAEMIWRNKRPPGE